ncbi:PH domain-containing protein [Pediococcus acidilactici]|uniref:PH domain-containing protein n=1 Tax=Pediococcus acidilactici TaxID=1254 RepID=UPI001BD54CE7|nr:PH domain-containing protein [Pediococcus acidilactici]MBS9400070.1 PH domain-containing protein [Pediococcus acidilactici]MDO7803238.1 PH domain-containing protein [Pediococcus acidilactici]
MEYKTDKKIVVVHLIQNAIIIGIALSLTALCLFLFKKINLLLKIVLVVDSILIFLAIYDACFYIPLEYKYNKLSIRGDHILIRKGLFIKTTIKVPLCKLYTVKTAQGPIEKLFNIKNLTIIALADEFTMPALKGDEATSLSEFLLKAIRNANKL